MSREDVRALVSRAAQEQELHPFDLQITRKIRVRSHTDHPATAHFHARSQNRPTEYCIKLFDTSTRDNQKFFQREADLLERLSHTKVAQSVSMTPQVRLADAKAGVLVMEWLVLACFIQDSSGYCPWAVVISTDCPLRKRSERGASFPSTSALMN